MLRLHQQVFFEELTKGSDGGFWSTCEPDCLIWRGSPRHRNGLGHRRQLLAHHSDGETGSSIERIKPACR